MKSLRLSTRFALSFGTVLALLLLISALGVHRMSQIEASLRTIVEHNNAQTRMAVTMRLAINQVTTSLRNMILMTDVVDMKGEMTHIEKSRADYNTARDQLARLLAARTDAHAEEDALFGRLQALQKTVSPMNDRVIELGLQNKNEEATEILLKQIAGPQAEWLNALDALAAYEDRATGRAAAEATDDYEQGRNTMVLGCSIALLASVGVAVWLTVYITRQIGGEPQDVTSAVQRIAAGDLSGELALRDGDRTSLLAGMKTMQKALVEVVERIRFTADSIASGTSQIASGNADLSQRTEAQASNLQQTAASMEQLNVTVKNNADVARQAAQLAASATAVACRGGEVVKDVVATMGEIAQASQKVAEIIGVIDGIAFQTNILALNAAVEAARAGEQGRGFAVVAGEVRTLASRSAEAAREIKTLIGSSAVKVESGSTLVGDAGRAMADIVDEVRRVGDLLSELGAAAQEQTSGIGQVSHAISQLDEVTQQNAALVEESAAAADSLRQQAGRLVESVAVFHTVAPGGAPDTAPRSTGLARSAPARSNLARRNSAPQAAPRTTTRPTVTPETTASGSTDEEWTAF